MKVSIKDPNCPPWYRRQCERDLIKRRAAGAKPRHGRTGVPCVTFFRTAAKRRDGTVKSYFSVHYRNAEGQKRNRLFCLDTLGRPEAWRRALAFRAQHERASQS